MKHSKSDRCLTPSHPDTLYLGYIGIREGFIKVVYELFLFGETTGTHLIEWPEVSD